MLCLIQVAVFVIILVIYMLRIKKKLFKDYETIYSVLKKADSSYDTLYYYDEKNAQAGYQKAQVVDGVNYFDRFSCKAFSKYFMDFLFIKNRNPLPATYLTSFLPILILLVAVFTNSDFFNGLLCITFPFIAVFHGLEKTIRTYYFKPDWFQKPLDPKKSARYPKGAPYACDTYFLIYFARIMTDLSFSLLSIQAVLGSDNIFVLVISLVILLLICFFEPTDRFEHMAKPKKEKRETVYQIVFSGCVAALVKIVKGTSLVFSSVYLIPIILVTIILGYILFRVSRHRFFVLHNPEKYGYGKPNGVCYLFIPDAMHECHLDHSLDYIRNDKDFAKRQKANQEADKIHQEYVRKLYKFRTSEEIAQEVIDYRDEHATMWLGGEKVTPKEYDEFCRRYGYGKYRVNPDAPDELEKKEKEGGYSATADSTDATDRFNKQRR